MTRTEIPVTRGNAGDAGDNIEFDATSDSKKVQAVGLRRSDDNKELATITAAGVLVVARGLASLAKPRAVTVTTTRSLLDLSAVTGLHAVWVHNKGPVVVFVGFSDVTANDHATTGGWEIPPGVQLPLPYPSGVSLYVVTAAGSATLKLWPAT